MPASMTTTTAATSAPETPDAHTHGDTTHHARSPPTTHHVPNRPPTPPRQRPTRWRHTCPPLNTCPPLTNHPPTTHPLTAQRPPNAPVTLTASRQQG
ncbi:hypothetical protein DXG01_011584, partial [Tephrocybe rancida]